MLRHGAPDIYKAFFYQLSPICHACPIANTQCREVDKKPKLFPGMLYKASKRLCREDEGKPGVSAVTIPTFSWDKPKQMENKFTTKKNLGRHKKAT